MFLQHGDDLVLTGRTIPSGTTQITDLIEALRTITNQTKNGFFLYSSAQTQDHPNISLFVALS